MLPRAHDESARDLTKKTEGTPVGRFGRVLTAIPYLLVAGVVAFDLVNLRAEITPVAYLNDGGMHSEMVRFATAQLRAGHLPLTAWFPFLGEGSPHFLHYQSLGATLTGALGLAVGPNNAFAWVLYLTVATWPVSIFLGARAAGFDALEAALAAVVSPLVYSLIGIGYEQRTYLWTGYGLWSQELAMWTLPLAWGYSFRAVRSRRALLPAALFGALTMGFHFLTGYLVVIGMFTAFLTADNAWRERIRHFVELALATAALAAWIVVPLLWFRPYASINEFLQQGPDVNSYGARQILEWLVTGKLFDQGRVMVLTPLVLGGLVLLGWRSRRSAACRNLLALFGCSLILFFGRTTFGRLTAVIPGSADLFFRRFLMGVQLAGILAAGVALRAVAAAAYRVLFEPFKQPALPEAGTLAGVAPGEPGLQLGALALGMAGPAPAGQSTGPAGQSIGPAGQSIGPAGQSTGSVSLAVGAESTAGIGAAAVARAGLGGRAHATAATVLLGLIALGGALSPAFSEISTIASDNATYIAAQHQADLTQGREIAPMISLIRREGGRVYAGLPVGASQIGGWGSSLTVGYVPVYKYLAWENIDEVGFTLRTASLMTDPEVYFDENIAADYPLFGVRWLIFPLRKKPVVPATRVMVRGPYALWRLSTSGYLQVVDTVGTLSANRRNIGHATAAYVRSDQAASRRYLTIAYDGKPAPSPTALADRPSGPAGRVLHSKLRLATLGSASATVVAARNAVVLLKASYDPGWRATVDGRPVPVEMISPAYVGVAIGPGRHRVGFTYERWGLEGPLLDLAAAGLVVLALIDVRVRRRSAASVRKRS